MHHENYARERNIKGKMLFGRGFRTSLLMYENLFLWFF